MTTTNGSSIAKGLVRIHAVITRSLEVTKSRSQAFSREGLSDPSLRTGFVGYAHSFVSVLHAHHLFEEEIAFPFLRDRIPDAPYDELTAQHREIVSLLDEMKAAADDVQGGRGGVEPLERIHSLTTRLAAIWYPHIETEEGNFTAARIAAAITPDEDLRLMQASAEHAQKHTGPDYLVVPFILFNLGPLERAAMAKTMPLIVTQQLVPVAWKEQWAPMKPFLLS